MKITDAARVVILETMEKHGLDPKVFSFLLRTAEKDGSCAFAFTRVPEFGKKFQFEELNVIVAFDLDVTNLIIDCLEVDGRTGLVFLEEQND